MKKDSKKQQKVVKGMPSAVLLSILIHVGLFLIATTLVVFSVVKKKEVPFEAPKTVERPKMKLKKPKVNVKKSSRPKTTTRIVTKSNRASMPVIELPELGGIGDGLGDGGLGGFDIMPDLGEVTVFGAGQTIGNDFVGTLYDFKRTRDGRSTGIDPASFLFELAKFTKGDWQEADLSRYYRSPRKLYTTHFMIPTVSSDIAPAAFGEPSMMGYAWAAFYKGQIVHPEGGTFRFWAQGDDIIIVRLDGRIMVDGSVSDSGSLGSFRQILTGYENMTADNMKYYMGERQAAVGEWFKLEPGVPLEMEVVIGESPGGSFSAMLAIQEKGVEYPTEASCTNGPVFSDYAGAEVKAALSNAVSAEAGMQVPGPEQNGEPQIRTWAVSGDQALEAVYVVSLGDKVVLKTADGREVKINRNTLSAGDIEYIELSSPPELEIDFRAKSSQRLIATRDAGVMGSAPEVLRWQFGAAVKQTSVGDYNQELTIEYHAVGRQVIDSNKYILLDRGSDRFTPTKQNKRSHSFLGGRTIELMKYITSRQSQGREYAGGVVVVRDKRGRIIHHKATKKWLWEHYEKLENLPIGAFMDDQCNRVYPSGPKPNKY
jgi:hypothetical protein